MTRNLILKSFTWAVSITSLFVITLFAAIISIVVGDWLMLKTENPILAWGVGFSVFMGFLCSLGSGIGIWIWLKAPTSYETEEELSRRLAEISSSERE